MMARKLRSKRGMTLTELVASMMIIGLLGSAIAVGTMTAVRAQTTINLSSESSILCSTISTAVSDELRYAKRVDTITVGGVDYVSYYSQTFGSNAYIHTEEGRVVIGGKVKDSADPNDEGFWYYLLGEKAYTYDLQADVEVVYNDTEDYFEVTVQILQGIKVWASSDFIVHRLNA